jgi:hypothetical protein
MTPMPGQMELPGICEVYTSRNEQQPLTQYK